MGRGNKRIITEVNSEALDSTMESMEETRFRKRNQPLTKRLAQKLHFTYREIEHLLLIYYKMQKVSKNSRKGIGKHQFRDVLHSGLDMTDDNLMDRIFYTLDKGTSSFMSMEIWITSLSLFLRGTLDEKINYCFSVYDAIGEGVLGKDALFHLLKRSIISSSGIDDAEETAKEMIEMLTKKMDLDRDGKISYNDYRQAVIKQPMLLEAFGQCLPTRRNIHAFITTFAHKVDKM